ncbi:MAG: BlaI/MecI/CopY family transcriptional regulator [Ferruginibacter sp.]|nr:BlaI/MecI/CopY family transcriptional regulator [Chitinophagaceae bacterium]MBP6286854.1 BlaI/MecI/CopY family transcriptional regulator [Ferruginibacter sp.]MBU9935393.1 BlaI/MecI/CopY family transcriptional regulator [Ferruginibacter sp.]HQY12040.1 BlaI/MecI/CopY family transcriptional regulator [Ferruginibacter sp.]
MKTLTKAEEQIMQVIWKLDKAFLREIIDELAAPKPHNNTVATILKILVDKEFVGINVFGRTHQYYPLVSKDAYSKTTMKSLVKGYFEGSFSNAVSFMVKENNLSIDDLELLLKQLKKR